MSNNKSIFEFADKFGITSPFEKDTLDNRITEDIPTYGGLYGYLDLTNTSYGVKNLLTRVLNSNSVWINYLKKTFVNIGSGDKLGSNTNGKYYKVLTIFRERTDKEIEDDGQGLDVFGETRIEYFDEKKKEWINLKNLSSGITKAFLRVTIIINTKTARGLEGIDTIVHETVLHGEGKAKMILEYLEGKVSLPKLKENHINNLKKGEDNKGHRQLVKKTNTSYNQINEETMKVLDKMLTPKIEKRNHQYLDHTFFGIGRVTDTTIWYEFRIPMSKHYALHLWGERNSYSKGIRGQLRADFLKQDENPTPPHEIFKGKKINNLKK